MKRTRERERERRVNVRDESEVRRRGIESDEEVKPLWLLFYSLIFLVCLRFWREENFKRLENRNLIELGFTLLNEQYAKQAGGIEIVTKHINAYFEVSFIL